MSEQIPTFLRGVVRHVECLQEKEYNRTYTRLETRHCTKTLESVREVTYWKMTDHGRSSVAPADGGHRLPTLRR